MLDASIGSDLSLSPSSLSLGASRADDATKLVDRPTAPVAAALADDPVAHLAELGARASECASQGDFAQAAEYLESALAGAERAFGKHHDAVVPFLNNLAQLHFRRRDFAAAEPVRSRAVSR